VCHFIVFDEHFICVGNEDEFQAIENLYKVHYLVVLVKIFPKCEHDYRDMCVPEADAFAMHAS